MRTLQIGGLYRHYKGKNYRVVAQATHSETLEQMRRDGTSAQIIGHYLPDAEKYLEVGQSED